MHMEFWEHSFVVERMQVTEVLFSPIFFMMGSVRIRHSSHKLPPSPVILCIELDGKPKWPPLNFG